MGIRINPETIVWNRVENETLVLNLESGFYYTLDEVAGLVWQSLLENSSRDEIASRISKEYNVTDSQTVCDDINLLLEELANEGLIERH